MSTLRGRDAAPRPGEHRHGAAPDFGLRVDRRTRNAFVVALLVVVAVAGGAALLLGGSGRQDPGAPDGTVAAVGVVVAIDSGGLADVRGFTLRSGDGSLLDFDLGRLENGPEFPPGHLAEHQATAQPVWVWYRDEDGTRYAIQIRDAP